MRRCSPMRSATASSPKAHPTCSTTPPAKSQAAANSASTRRRNCRAKASTPLAADQDGRGGEGEGGKAFSRCRVNPRRWPRTIPKGLRPPAQGCEERAFREAKYCVCCSVFPWVSSRQTSPTPTGLRPFRFRVSPTPLDTTPSGLFWSV